MHYLLRVKILQCKQELPDYLYYFFFLKDPELLFESEERVFRELHD